MDLTLDVREARRKYDIYLEVHAQARYVFWNWLTI